MRRVTRKEALEAYLTEVTRDLLLRGLIRKQSGQSMGDILAQESATILGSIARDFQDAGFSVGGSLVRHLLGAVFGQRQR